MAAIGVKLAAFGRDERGATAIEYGLIAALVVVGVIFAITTLGGSLSAMFNYVASTSSAAMGG